MKVNLAKSAGFCFGVKRALRIALDTAASAKKIYMLGDIVHNEDVVRQISDAGIKRINRLSLGKNKILLVSAHGSSRAVVEKARKLGYCIVDATCPMVKEIHKIAKNFERKGYRIIVIGDKLHSEVVGIAGQLKSRAIVIDRPENIPVKIIKNIKKACVVAQSTQNIENVENILSVLRPKIRDLKFFNTICMPTRTKQEEIRKMPLINDVMIIIGSKASANTKRLYEISKSLNKQTYWVSSIKEINPGWFKDGKNAGVTAGASTPDSTTQEIIRYLSTLTA